jgi:hypothetical protein
MASGKTAKSDKIGIKKTIQKDNKTPLRRTITRTTLKNDMISKSDLQTILSKFITEQKMPKIQGMNKMEKRELVDNIPLWLVARVYVSWQDLQKQKQKEIESLSVGQKKLVAELSEFSADNIRTAVKDLNLEIKNKNCKKDELIFKIVKSGNGDAVASYFKKNNISKESKGKKTAKSAKEEPVEEIVIEVEMEEAKPVEQPQVKPAAPAAPPIADPHANRHQNNKQPSARAIEAAMRVAQQQGKPVPKLTKVVVQ